MLVVRLRPGGSGPLLRVVSGLSLSASRYLLSHVDRSRVSGLASGEPLTLSILSSFLGQRGYEADEAAGMVGLKCAVEGAGTRTLLGDANGPFGFVGEAGREPGRTRGNVLGAADLCGLGVVPEGIRCVRGYKGRIKI